MALLGPRSLALAEPERPGNASGGAERGEVTISTAEYRRLVEAAERPAGKPGPEVTFEAAHFRVTIERESALFVESFRARTGAAGWVSTPFARAGLDRGTISPSGRGFFFVSRDFNHVALLGPTSAEGEVSARVATTSGSDGRRSFVLSFPLVPVQKGVVELPGGDLEVTVTGAEILSRSERAGVTHLEIAGRAAAPLTISFRQKNVSESKASAPLAVSATLYAREEIVGANLVTDVFARLVPTAGRISAVEFAVPAGCKALFLRGPGLLAAETSADRIRAARASPSPEPLEALLRLTRPVDEAAPIELLLPRLMLPGPVDLYVDFRAPQGALAEIVDAGSLESIDAGKLPRDLQALATEAEEILHLPSSAAKKLQPPLIRLHRLEAAPVLTAQVRVARGWSVISRTGHALSRIEYEVVSSVKPFLTVLLPPGGSFWGAEAMGKPILPAMPEKGSIAIPLRPGRRRLARVVAYVLSQVDMPRGRGTLVFQPPSADIPISRLQWSFSLPSGAEYKAVGSDYREAEALDVAVPTVEADRAASELAQRAQLALGQETRAAGRDPIVPRMPDVATVIIVRSELPSPTLKPVKLEVRPGGGSEVWR
jgi:hypothetical protein